MRKRRVKNRTDGKAAGRRRARQGVVETGKERVQVPPQGKAAVKLLLCADLQALEGRIRSFSLLKAPPAALMTRGLCATCSHGSHCGGCSGASSTKSPLVAGVKSAAPPPPAHEAIITARAAGVGVRASASSWAAKPLGPCGPLSALKSRKGLRAHPAEDAGRLPAGPAARVRDGLWGAAESAVCCAPARPGPRGKRAGGW